MMRWRTWSLLLLCWHSSHVSRAFSTQRPAAETAVPFSTGTSTPSFSSTPLDTNLPRRPKSLPITVISGFLGSGKTTLLQHLLHNNQGLRIAVIVNDVASVNIDSKLLSEQNLRSQPNRLSSPSTLENSPNNYEENNNGMVMIELQNGCACCSRSEELLASVAEVVTLQDLRAASDDPEAGWFDHIVVEMSGVADPRSVRAHFQEAVLYDMPLMQRVYLDTLVTVVDGSTFLDYLTSRKLASPEESPELFVRAGSEETSKDWSKDLPSGLLEALAAGASSARNHQQADSVVELLVAQTETADVILLNKMDLIVDDSSGTVERVSLMENMIRALNPRAQLMRTEYGRAPLESILAVAGGQGVAEAGPLDDHRDAVRASTTINPEQPHDHRHHHDDDEEHQLIIGGELAAESMDSHDHSHHHDHSSCTDPHCHDPSHTHDHDHSLEGDRRRYQHTYIGNFVYRARRPFHPGRLLSFLRRMPITRGLPGPMSPEDQGDQDRQIRYSESVQQSLGRVLRSKGFVWCADSHVAALYWSQASSNFELVCLGSWWATLPKAQWPPEAVTAILEDFEPKDGDESWALVGDRRQEIVFIGESLGDSAAMEGIKSALDQCLLHDDEWAQYVEQRSDPAALRSRFPNPISTKMLTY